MADKEGRLMIYRCYQGPKTEEANVAAMNAYECLQSVPPIVQSSGRGQFSYRYFMFHRENLAVSRA